MERRSNKNYRNEEVLRKVGDKIRKVRLNRGLTQSELAFKCGDIDLSQISRIERGLVNFTISYLFLIAEILEVPVSELLDEN